MPALVWEDRSYEAGVDRGVLYIPGIITVGVPWNGLVSVEEASTGGEVESRYLDGVNFLNVVKASDFRANVTAFSAPREFLDYVGNRVVAPGVQVTKQPKPRFHFAYRVTTDYGYEIHLVYNCLATQTENSDTTISDVTEPKILSWTFDATPDVVPSVRPSAHYVVRSNGNPTTVAELEEMLYGGVSIDPTIPSATSLLAMFD